MSMKCLPSHVDSRRFLVAYFFGNIAVHHGRVWTSYQGQFVPSVLPDIPKPTRTLTWVVKPRFLHVLSRTKQKSKRLLNKHWVYGPKSSNPKFWRSPRGVAFCVDSAFQLENNQTLHPQAKIEKTCFWTMFSCIFRLLPIFQGPR